MKRKNTGNKTGVINDPLGQTHSLASSEHCFRLKFVSLWKVGTGGRTNDMCKNNDHYRSWLWVGLVDQLETIFAGVFWAVIWRFIIQNFSSLDKKEEWRLERWTEKKKKKKFKTIQVGSSEKYICFSVFRRRISQCFVWTR